MSSDIATWSADKKANKEKQEASLTDYASRVLAPSTYQMYDGAYEHNKKWATQLSDPAYIKQMTSTTEGIIMYEQALTGLQSSIAEHTDHYVTTYGTAQDDSSVATFSGGFQRTKGPNPYLESRLEDTNGIDHYQGVLDAENNPAKYSGYQFNPQTGLMQKTDPDALDISMDQNIFKPSLSEILPLDGGGYFHENENLINPSYSDRKAAEAAIGIQYDKPHLKSSVHAHGDAARIFASANNSTEEEVKSDPEYSLKARKDYIAAGLVAYDNSAGRITFLREQAEEAAAAAAALAEANGEEVGRELPQSFRAADEPMAMTDQDGNPYEVKTIISSASNDSRLFKVQLDKTDEISGQETSYKNIIGDVHFDKVTGDIVAFQLLNHPTALDLNFEANSSYNRNFVKAGGPDFQKVYDSLYDARESGTQISGQDIIERGKEKILNQYEFYRDMSEADRLNFNNNTVEVRRSIIEAMQSLEGLGTSE